MEDTRSHKRVVTLIKRNKPLPVLAPWREVGWIFKDGEAIAVERHEYETRTRKVAS
jgi:hypothetical protein